MSELEGLREKWQRRLAVQTAELVKRIDWPRDRLDAHRRDVLRTVLSQVIDRSPWHRERLAGLDVARFEPKDLASLPTMTKSDLMTHFDAISTDPRITLERCEEHIERGDLLMDGEFAVSASGGSSGVRAIGIRRLDEAAGGGRFIARWASRTGALRGPATKFGIGAAPGPHVSHILASLFSSGVRSVLDPLDEIVQALNAAQPEHLTVYGSFVPRLIEEARAGRLRIRPKVLSPSAEPLLPEFETLAAEVWGCAIMSVWGASEVGVLGGGSGFDSGMLLCDDINIVEPVDAGGRPVPSGTPADKLFVTPLLLDHPMPVIRYELTDQLTVLTEPATCGSSFTRVSDVVGRLDDEFVYEGGRLVHAHVFRAVLARERAVREYQVIQTERGADVRVVLSPGAGDSDAGADFGVGRLSRDLAANLMRLGLRDPEVRVERTSAIERLPGSAKLRRFVPIQGGEQRPAAAGA